MRSGYPRFTADPGFPRGLDKSPSVLLSLPCRESYSTMICLWVHHGQSMLSRMSATCRQDCGNEMPGDLSSSGQQADQPAMDKKVGAMSRPRSRTQCLAEQSFVTLASWEKR